MHILVPETPEFGSKLQLSEHPDLHYSFYPLKSTEWKITFWINLICICPGGIFDLEMAAVCRVQSFSAGSHLLCTEVFLLYFPFIRYELN